jgi:hypothetical protein
MLRQMVQHGRALVVAANQTGRLLLQKKIETVKS